MTKQYATFSVGGRLYGIDVIDVQEVTRTLALTPVPLAPEYIAGLMNLRGQIAPAVGLRLYFDRGAAGERGEMTVVCRTKDGLLSLLVDRIGDVVEVTETQHESVPEHIDDRVKRVLSGLYKLEDTLLSIIEIEKLASELDQKESVHVA